MTVYLVHGDGTVETLTTRRTPAEVTADREHTPSAPVLATADRHAAEVCARLVAERNDLDVQTGLVRAITSPAASLESIALAAQSLARMGRGNLAQRLCDLVMAERTRADVVAAAARIIERLAP